MRQGKPRRQKPLHNKPGIRPLTNLLTYTGSADGSAHAKVEDCPHFARHAFISLSSNQSIGLGYVYHGEQAVTAGSFNMGDHMQGPGPPGYTLTLHPDGRARAPLAIFDLCYSIHWPWIEVVLSPTRVCLFDFCFVRRVGFALCLRYGHICVHLYPLVLVHVFLSHRLNVALSYAYTHILV